MVKIYDTFLFFNELDLLEIRFHQHYPFVDHFIICESAFTFTGSPKPKIFLENKARFAPFLDKVIYLPLDEFPSHLNTGQRDAFQREFLLTGLTTVAPDDLIIFSDLDEILDQQAIEKAKHFDGVSHFRMKIFQFYLNMPIPSDWLAPYALPAKYIPKLAIDCPFEGGSLTYARYNMERMCKLHDISLQVINDSGWHFTFMGGFDIIKAKLRGYAHANDYWPAMMRDDARLQQALDIGIKIWSAEELVQFAEIDSSFPKYIQENQKELTEKGLIRNIYAAHRSLQQAFMQLRKNFALFNLKSTQKIPDLGNMPPTQYLAYIGALSLALEAYELPAPRGRLVSDAGRATQSSRSGDAPGATTEEEASRALTGKPDGNFSFHTNREEFPWWEVDLQKPTKISEIRIFNRLLPYLDNSPLAARANHLSIHVSSNGETYRCIYLHANSGPIGGIDGNPLIFHPPVDTVARFVRLRLEDVEYFNLDKVFVYAAE